MAKVRHHLRVTSMRYGFTLTSYRRRIASSPIEELKKAFMVPEFAAQHDLDSVDGAIRQYGALCHRTADHGREVLLITTRQTRRWMIPKGWPIPGLDPSAVAEQEAWEEAGIIGRAKHRNFGAFHYGKELADGRKVRPLVEVHLLKARKQKRRFPEMAERDVVWLNPVDAANRVCEPELKQLLLKFGLASNP
jgi:8-oxo-dGTP pyrophosphatase MutT (NUDIX family)